MSEHTVALSLGSNEGNRLRTLSRALNSLRLSKFDIKKVSRVWETEPWGNKDQGRFLNMCLVAVTELEPAEMLAVIKKIESDLGRTKTEHWGPREIDIDIIFIDGEVIDTPELKVPHPYMQERAFVLVPLAEIAADMVHPVLKMSVAELLKKIPKEDMEWIIKF
jgi:2-amino-4-hydroxy-6-hydroxymethyldihydropteridine diphosphokinase